MPPRTLSARVASIAGGEDGASIDEAEAVAGADCGEQALATTSTPVRQAFHIARIPNSIELLPQRLFEISNQIVGVLDADRQPDQRLGDAEPEAFIRRHV